MIVIIKMIKECYLFASIEIKKGYVIKTILKVWYKAIFLLTLLYKYAIHFDLTDDMLN